MSATPRPITGPTTCPICGKQRLSRCEARRAARAMESRTGEPIRPYWCISCAAWHVGHAGRAALRGRR